MPYRRMTSAGAWLALTVAGLFGPASSAWADDGPSVSVTVPEHTTPPAQPVTLTCAGADGKALGANPTLHPRDQLSCTGTGFAAGEPVNATLAPARSLGTVTAGQDGESQLDVSLPADLGAGSQTLRFTGNTSRRTASFAFTVTIVVSVPVGGGTAAPGDGSDNSGGHGLGSLPRTGLNIMGIGLAGAVLIGGGVVLRRLGRRRKIAGPGGDRG
ncbi:hypothetical protein HH310_08365 [Actinoplanes sp. TBRC 11911]|uniref:hypothetical protein n=1 Tax=Actinoplanes sp. TBRC 11911 TaxID=2729386 RepID=UPI00145CAA46|nr:hypothetical protein [Actinoplanes sp. TBRC 11911]NMO51200.1 hypothetical protein [Actinoplanes sp. TBRC 11911]